MLKLVPFLSRTSTFREIHTTVALDRARRATRERKRKIDVANKKAKEERLRKKPPPLPEKMKLLLRSHGIYGKVKPLRANETDLTFAVDNCFETYKFCYIRYEFNDALKNVRDHYHPSLLNRPDDILHAKVELNMAASKKDKYLDEFSKMVPIIHPFDEKMRTKNICVFVQNEEDKKKALEAGAFLAGGVELIQDMIKGNIDVADIDNFVCHDEMYVNMKSLAGILRDKTPSKNNDGTVGSDVVRMVRIFRTGLEVQVKKVIPSLFIAEQPDYGYCHFPLGKLTQDPQELKENMESLLSTLNEHRVRKDGKLVTRVNLELLDGPKNASFSIRHHLIDDKKLEQHLYLLNKQKTAEI